jgi:AcrR family transcriptional regulator
MSRKPLSAGAESSRASSERKPDRRVRKTRDLLGDALVDLMREKPFASITVQQVLDRAGIGRSTFYSHYRDKDDLFFSDVDDFWSKASTSLWCAKENSQRVAPVRELFSHVAEAREFYQALVASGRLHDVMELGQGHFARSIEQHLAQAGSGSDRAQPNPPVPEDVRRRVMAQALAGAMFSLLDWWIRHSKPLPADEVDALFHELVSSGAFGRLHPSLPVRQASSQGK